MAAQTEIAGELIFEGESRGVIPCSTNPRRADRDAEGRGSGRKPARGRQGSSTRDNGIQEIRWGRSAHAEPRGAGAWRPNLKPILIKAGALGHGLPPSATCSSRRSNRVLVSGGSHPALLQRKAKFWWPPSNLVNSGLGSRSWKPCARPTSTSCSTATRSSCRMGAWTESFQPGDQSLGAMGSQELRRDRGAVPRAGDGGRDFRLQPPPRRALKSHEAKLLQRLSPRALEGRGQDGTEKGRGRPHTGRPFSLSGACAPNSSPGALRQVAQSSGVSRSDGRAVIGQRQQMHALRLAL